jgi:hypothetical protein
MLAAFPSPVADSWARSPDADLPPDTKRRLRAFLEARERERGELTNEERLLLALCWAGTTAPLVTLARVAGISPNASNDSARKQGRRLWERLQARGIGVQRHVRASFAECTHVRTPGHPGRKECEALRKELGVTTGCTAHHGHDVRTLADGLTPAELARRLDLPAGEVTARVQARRGENAARRKELGKAGNDAEAREWRGLPTKRGARGSNRIRPLNPRHVPPIPPEGLKEPETSASSGTVGGTIDGELGPKARASGAPTALEVVMFAEPTSAPPEPPRLFESTEGGEAKESCRNVASLSAGRVVARARDEFRDRWNLRGLPPLGRSDLNRLWCACRELSREELDLAFASAERLARFSLERLFRRVFADRGTLAELIHEQRRRRENIVAANSGAGAGRRGGAPARPHFDRASPGETGPGQSAGGGGRRPPIDPPATLAASGRKLPPAHLLSAGEFQRRVAEQREILLALDAADAPAPVRLPPVPAPAARTLPPAEFLSDAEFQRRAAEQREILLALDADELVEIPIVGEVK